MMVGASLEPSMPAALGKYRIVRRLAVGGMGEIFLATQVGLRGFTRPAIIKTLLPDLASDRQSVEQFLDEARLAATVNHPHVVSVYEVGAADGRHFIAMEYIDGATLSRLIVRAMELGRPIPFAVAAKVARDAARGLFAAHTARSAGGVPLELVHRDISPRNLMVRRDGVVKVLDFGIASAKNRITRTDTGVIKGKLGYMAPEQLFAEGVDARADQHALGVVLWEMCTGRRMVQLGTDEVLKLAEVMHAPPPSPAVHRPDIPVPLEEIIMTMVARSRSDRFRTCRDVADALDRFLGRPRTADDLAAWVDGLVGGELSERSRVLAAEAGLGSMAEGASTTVLLPKKRARYRRWGAVAFVALLGAQGLWYWPSARSGDLGAQTAGADVYITSAPSRATVWLGERRLGATPLRVGVLSAGETLRLRVTLDGHQPQSFALTTAANEVTTRHVDLEPVAPPGPGAAMRSTGRSPPSVARPSASTQAPSSTRAPSGRASSSARPKGSPPAPSPAPLATGKLSVDSRPNAQIMIDGRRYGATPKLGIVLSVGEHVVVLENPPLGLRRQRAVTIRKGETTKLIVRLDEAP